jgi:hypothetical protein
MLQERQEETEGNLLEGNQLPIQVEFRSPGIRFEGTETVALAGRAGKRLHGNGSGALIVLTVRDKSKEILAAPRFLSDVSRRG